MTRTVRHIAIATLLVLSTLDASAAAQTHGYAGRPVAEVLRELQTPDLNIIFSSDLVPPTLLIKAEPKSATPRQLAQQILAPHGLALVTGPRGRLLVVSMRRETGPAPATQPAPTQMPTPVSESTDEIRIEERVDVTDQLSETKSKPAVYTLEPLKIQETAGGLDDVLRSMQLLPGTAATNDRDGKMAVRGAGPEHNVIVLDGVQIHNPHRLGEFTSSFLNPATAASVALDASGLEARHGGRLSSVTVIETRNGRSDRRLAFSGSLGLTSGDVLVEGRLPKTETGTWWAGARGTYYRALMDRFGDAVPGFGDVQFKLSVRPTRRTRLSIFSLLGRETAHEPGTAPDAGGVDGVATSSIEGSQSSNQSNGNAAASGTQYTGTNRIAVMNLSWIPGPRLAATTTVSAYGHNAIDYDGSLVIAGVAPFDRRVRVNDFAGRHRIEYATSPGHLLDTGVEAHRITSSWRMTGVKQLDAARGLGPSTGGELVDYSRGPIDTSLSRTQAGAWLQYLLPFGSIWTAEPGVRLEWNSFTRESSVQPRMRVAAHIGNTLLWTGVAIQAQTPSHESLLGFDYFHLTDAVGATLRNERSRQFVAGVEQTFAARLKVRVEAYRRRFDRLLVHRLETEAERSARLARYAIPADLPPDHVVLEFRPTVEAESTGRGSASGVEVLLQGGAARMTGSLAYTFSKATREMYGHVFPFDFDRPHALAATLGVQVTRQVRVAATWQRASGFPVTPVREEIRFTRAISRDGTVDPIFRTTRLPDGTLVKSPSPAMRRLSQRNTRAFERLRARRPAGHLSHPGGRGSSMPRCSTSSTGGTTSKRFTTRAGSASSSPATTSTPSSNGCRRSACA